MRRVAVPLALGLLAPLSAQPADEVRRALADTRLAGERADARARRLTAAAAAADKRVAASARAIADAERALAANERAFAIARTRFEAARAAELAGAATLARERAPLAELVAALVRQQRRPPMLDLLAQPDLARTMRLRAALAGVAPELERRTATLRAQLATAAHQRADAAVALRALATARRARDADRAQLRLALAAATGRRDLARGDAEAARQQAEGISEQGAELEALVAGLGAQAATATRLAALPGPDLRPGTVAAPAPWPAYRMPASGRLLAGFGAPGATGVHMRGLLLATVPGGIVRAPADGRIAYAGAFRTWRAIAIIDHGRGWTSLVAGLGAASLPAGAHVRQGVPLGRATTRLLVELRHHGRPFDVAALAEASN